ncbi:MAG: c-type cytochrome [Saprospiraceae bacterium]
MKYIGLTTSILVIFLLSISSMQIKNEILKDNTSVGEVLEKLGDTPLAKPDLSVNGVSAEKGKSLILTGFAKAPSGKMTDKQSKHFVCTSCHNIQREDPDLTISDPQARLEYAVENGLPFLQGTTLYGAANRTNFYNDYYVEKYGDLVEDAKDDIRGAIKLCAVECAQGREIEKWEVESVLAYLWEIDLKISDLALTEAEHNQIEKALNANAQDADLIKLIKEKYLQGSPATFVKPPENRKTGYNLKGDPANGKLIYEASCLHCHENQRYTFFNLNDTPLSHKFMTKHIPRYTRYSLYQVSRYGTYPLPGKRAYMPLYTAEKMSNQQMEDLRAYMKKMADSMN